MNKTCKNEIELQGLCKKICCINKRLDDKIVLVTGANRGLGIAITSELARRGAKIIMVCKNFEKAQTAKNFIVERYGSKNPRALTIDLLSKYVEPSMTVVKPEQLIIEQVDMSNLQSIRDLATRIVNQFNCLHYLINNAGIICPNYEKTIDGLEMIMGVNYFGPFLLTYLLSPLLKQSTPSSSSSSLSVAVEKAKIINISSKFHFHGNLDQTNFEFKKNNFKSLKNYANSKLALTMYTMELSEKLKKFNITTVSVHPGFLKTSLLDQMNSCKDFLIKLLMKPFAISPLQGVQTILYVILKDDLIPGGYYDNCKCVEPHHLVHNTEKRKWMFQETCKLIGIDEF